MPDVNDVLQERASWCAHAVSLLARDPNWIWGWSGEQYNRVKDGPLRVTDGGWFWHPRIERTAVHLDLIRAVRGIQGETTSEAVPVGNPYVQWAEEGHFRNQRVRTEAIIQQIKDGLLPNDYDFLDYTFTAHFAETMSWEESKEVGFREALSSTFGFEIGGDVYGGKVTGSVTAEFESTQTSGSRSGDEEESGDEESYSLRAGPGDELRVSAKREITPMKYIINGWGDLEHGVHIGQRPGHNRWAVKKGKGGRRYEKSLHWDSFAEFLADIKGDGHRDSYFRNHPAPQWLIDKLEAPLDQPFRQEVPYDDVGVIELVYL